MFYFNKFINSQWIKKNTVCCIIKQDKSVTLGNKIALEISPNISQRFKLGSYDYRL